MDRKRTELLTLGMGRLFVRLALPAVAGMAVLGLYNLVDAIFVGRFVGKDAVGAIVLVYPVVLANQAISTVIGMGSMSLLSRALGRGDHATIPRLAGNLMLTVAVLSGLLSAAVFFAADSILGFLGGSGAIRTMGVRYLKVLCLGFVFAAVGPALNMLLRGEGRMWEAMLIASSGMFLNIGLDPLFINVLGMDVTGAAAATVASQLAYLITGVLYFRLGRSIVKLEAGSLRFAFDLMPSILGVGASAMSMLVMVAVQQIIVFKALAIHGGNDHITLMAAAFRVLLFALIPLTGTGQGLQPVVGINYGARNHNRVVAAYLCFTLIATAMAASVWLLFMLTPGAILSWFFADQEFVAWGCRYFRAFLSLFMLMGVNITTIIFFQALGKGAHAAILALAKQAVLFIPLVLILPIFMDAMGVWLAMPLADGLTFLLAVPLLVGTFRRLGASRQTSASQSLRTA